MTDNNPNGGPNGSNDARHLETLDRDLARYSTLEVATQYVARPLVGPGISLVFIVLAGLVAALMFGQTNNSMIVIVASCFGAYMALNIGANDVANNMGPAVGANALSMGGAIAIAVVFESAGALIAGGDVVSTIAKGIIEPSTMGDATTFIWAMMAALLSAALWVNLATYVGAPVSTTHSVVGGVMGACIAAAGFGAVSWGTMSAIAASWVISPVLGGVIAAFFLFVIKNRIIYRDDKIAAARRWVPLLVGIMAGTFGSYLALKGLKKIIKIDMPTALLIGLGIAVLVWAIMIPVIKKQSEGLENRNKSLKVLFGIPLVVSAALLSFMIIGAFGISFGLFLFGPKLIRMVGSQITKLNPMRAYCVALSAAITVIVASWLGLPVSSTHIAVGGVFGVGFFREWDAERRLRRARAEMPDRAAYSTEERRRRKLVRRSHVMTILAAWVITVPAAAILSISYPRGPQGSCFGHP